MQIFAEGIFGLYPAQQGGVQHIDRRPFKDTTCTVRKSSCNSWTPTMEPKNTISLYQDVSLWKHVGFLQNLIPPIHRPSKKKFFCYILPLLSKWNMIFCLYGAFLENSLSKQNFPSPHMLAVCMQGEGESLSFFPGLAALHNQSFNIIIFRA